MFKHLILVSILIFSNTALANDVWEYQVVFLPGPAAGARVVKQAHGGFLDTKKTDILNKLGAQGWELVSVTASTGEDHAAYLRRQK